MPKVLYSVDEVAAMFGRAPDTIRKLCWDGVLPYRIETTWAHRHRCHRRMVFSTREIQAALDYFAPPVEQVLERTAAARRPPKGAAPQGETPADGGADGASA